MCRQHPTAGNLLVKSSGEDMRPKKEEENSWTSGVLGPRG
jgi:hypothetical protein